MKNHIFNQLALFGILFFLGFTSLQGQQRKVDIVYMHNGKVYEGKILPQEDASRIKLQTEDLSILWLSATAVDSIGKASLKLNPPILDSAARLFWPRRLTGFMEGNLGLQIGGDGVYNGGDYVYRMGGFCVGLDWNLSKHMMVGIAAAVEKRGLTWFYPLMFDLRVRPRAKRFSPLIIIDLGHAFARDFRLSANDIPIRNRGYRGGFYANPAVGISWCATPKTAFHFSAGIRIQHIWLNSAINHSESWYLNLKAGVSF